MKEGAIIHRSPVPLRSAKHGPPSFEMTVGFWILAGSNHRALPCAYGYLCGVTRRYPI